MYEYLSHAGCVPSDFREARLLISCLGRYNLRRSDLITTALSRMSSSQQPPSPLAAIDLVDPVSENFVQAVIDLNYY